MSNIRIIGQVAFHKPLTKYGMEELAARQRTILPSGGILFARATDREQKDKARQLVLDLFHPKEWPGRLHMLTMPGVHWRFERLLLATRETGWLRESSPRRTHFTGIENDRAIYFAAAAQMPGLHTPRALVRRMKPFPFAELGVKTHYGTFIFGNVNDLIQYQEWNPWNAAWLDFTGPLTVERMKSIQKFYLHSVSDTLIVTAMKARWTKDTVTAIDNAGGHSEWLRKYLPGDVLHDISYNDTVPMAQFAIRHPGAIYPGVVWRWGKR